jgi:AGZA family xanthine/uracil permease-like MFS transporter
MTKLQSWRKDWWMEGRAALVTFSAMSYILVVNPAILKDAVVLDGVDMLPELMAATALAAAVGSILMGWLADYPFALAPGMGLNAYFAFTVVGQEGVPWQTALGCVFLSGMIFLVLSLSRAREWVVNGIPLSLKRAVAGGIGFFLALIGAQKAGLLAADPMTFVTLGDLSRPTAWLALLGLGLMLVLWVRRIPGALILSILSCTLLAHVFHLDVFGPAPGVQEQVWWPSHLVGALDLGAAWAMNLWFILFTFVFMDFFDTAGSLFALGEVSGMVDDQGKMARSTQAFTADSLATMMGSVLGTTTTTTYIESAVGVEEGGRRGLTAVMVGLLFLCALPFSGWIALVPDAATAPALIMVGMFMMRPLSRLSWDRPEESFPGFLVVFGIPMTFSIANGIAFGIITTTLIQLCQWPKRQPSALMLVLSALFLLRFMHQFS